MSGGYIVPQHIADALASKWKGLDVHSKNTRFNGQLSLGRVVLKRLGIIEGGFLMIQEQAQKVVAVARDKYLKYKLAFGILLVTLTAVACAGFIIWFTEIF